MKRRERRTVMLESWDCSACGDESCAEPKATLNAIMPQANHIRFLDGTCRLLTIRNLNQGLCDDTGEEVDIGCRRRWDAVHNGARDNPSVVLYGMYVCGNCAMAHTETRKRHVTRSRRHRPAPSSAQRSHLVFARCVSSLF